MTIAPKLHQSLDNQHVNYEVIEHPPTRTSMEIAHICQIPAERLAKAVLLETEEEYLLAVLPSDRRIRLGELRSELGSMTQLADEEELAVIFDDCAVGAVPPLGSTYGVVTMIDDNLEAQPDVYFEAGDHVSLVHMEQSEFARLTREARHGCFSDQST